MTPSQASLRAQRLAAEPKFIAACQPLLILYPGKVKSVLDLAERLESTGITAPESPEQGSSAHLLRYKQAAKILAVHVNTIKNWIRKGTLKRVKICGVAGVTLSSVEALVQEGRQ